ncbi:MAG: NAD-dependent succinate-semialdehyde dehydrogenase [Acidobacteriota bacterium]
MKNGTMTYQTVNPATGELLRTHETHTDAQAEQALERARRAFSAWRSETPARRADLLSRMADTLEKRAPDLARTAAREMGKPLAQGTAEVKKCAAACRYFAENAETLLRPRVLATDATESLVRHDPMGPILAIMPWNYPFWQFYRFAAPALAAGNTVLLKHAPNTPECALAIEQLVLESGFPEGVVQNLFLDNAQAARLIADDRLCGVTLTGSTRAGREVGRVAGRNLKPLVLELGGSDPFIIFEDADLEKTVRAAVEARCQNSGQSCIAAKRFLVHRSLYGAFSEAFVREMSARPTGDPQEPRVAMGPLARQDLRDKLAQQVRASLAAGAKALCGGQVPEGKGFFYPATVLVDVPEGSPAAHEELFGPVAPLFAFDTEEEAVEKANDTRYGLGTSLWTSDRERIQRLVPQLETGMIFVNGLVRSDPRLPFGGIKESGFGRELGDEGILEFVNTKSVWIR